MSMTTFKYDAERFSELRKKVIVKSISVLVPAMAVGLYVGLSGHQAESGGIDVLPVAIPVAVIIALLAAGFGLFRGIKRQQALYASYRLTIDENIVTREQQNTQTIRLPKREIQLITKNANGSFTIKGRGIRDVIGIGPQIESYEELERLLRQIRPFGGTARRPLLERYGRSAGLMTIILFAIVFLSNSKTVVTPAGLVLIGLLCWSLVEVQRNRNIDAKTKRGMYMVIFPLFAVLAKLAFLWM